MPGGAGLSVLRGAGGYVGTPSLLSLALELVKGGPGQWAQQRGSHSCSPWMPRAGHRADGLPFRPETQAPVRGSFGVCCSGLLSSPPPPQGFVGEASAWNHLCCFLTGREGSTGIRTLVGLAHTRHTCTPRARTHRRLGQGFARLLTDTRPLPHTWSQRIQVLLLWGGGGWDSYSTQSENSTITRTPEQSRSTCCSECHGSSSSRRSGNTLTRAM